MVLRARNAVVVITDKGNGSGVSRYQDDQFWSYAKERLAVLEKQHHQEGRTRDLAGEDDPHVEGNKFVQTGQEPFAQEQDQ